MKSPITINDSPRIDIPGDLRVYTSVELAERSLEVYDASDSEIHVIDSEGLLLRIIPDPTRNTPCLEAAESTPTHLTILTTLLRESLVASGMDETLVEAMAVDELFAHALARNPNPYT